MLRPLTLSDPALLGGLGGAIAAPIDTSDADTQGWWKADSHIVENTSVGDKMDTTVDKTSGAAPNFNLFPVAGFPPPATGRGGSDNDANFVASSENLTDAVWAKSNFAAGAPTTGTFSAVGGYVRQRAVFTDEAATFTYRFKARRISGNTDLQILTVGAPEGDKTPVTLTGTLTEYSVSFTGVAGSEIYVGLEDDNAAGHGQIELTEQQVYRADHDGNYLTTGSQLKGGQRGGVPVMQCGFSSVTTAIFATGAARANAAPYTIYASVFVRHEYDGWFLVGSNPTVWGQIIAIDIASGNRIGVYSGGPAVWQYGAAPNVFVRGSWHIVTVVFNGASSELRIDKNTADSANLGAAANMNAMQVGGETFAGTIQTGTEFHEVILRYTADNTATQDSFIDYMASQVGLSV